MNVNINIVTTQFNELGEENVIKSNVDGTLYQKKDHKYIIYKEIENNEETTTSLKIEEEQITIKRFGALDSTLRFKVGKVDISSYLTPVSYTHLGDYHESWRYCCQKILQQRYSF